MFKKLNYLWRIVGTGIAFGTFGLGALSLAFFVFPSQLIFVRDPRRKRAVIRHTISWSFRSFMYFMHYLGLLRFHTENIDILKQERGCLLIANHPTLIDVVAIIAYCPNACCIVKEALWSNFYIKRVLRAAGYIPNREPESLLNRCRKAISEGDVLVIFPEGTRTRAGAEMIFQRGAAHIALMLDAPVRCVEITCVPLTLTKEERWYQVPSRRTDFTLRVKGRVLPYRHIGKEVPRPKAARMLTRLFLEQYCLMSGALVLLFI